MAAHWHKRWVPHVSHLRHGFAGFVATITLTFAIAHAQRPAKPELALELQAKDPLDGIPQRIRLTLRNMTDHDMRLPEPGIACSSQYGALWLRVSAATPKVQAHPTKRMPQVREANLGFGAVREPVTACATPFENTNPKRWITLGPGGYLDRWYSATRLHLRDAGAGRYDLQAEYLPPALSPTLTRSLAGEGILFPRSSVRSNHVIVTK